MRVGHRAALPYAAPKQEQPPPPAETAGGGLYVPSEHTISEVLEYVDLNPDQLESIYAAEQAGKARATLLTQLEDRRR